MKTYLAAVLVAAEFLLAAPHLAVAQETEEKVVPLLSDVSVFRMRRAPDGVEFHSWHQGEPPVKMIRKEEGFCALTGVGGGFAGGGEQAHVYIGDDGYWYLGGKSMQAGVSAECVVVRFPPAAAKVRKIKILAASYTFGSDCADVTERVKTLVREGTTFQANPDCLKVDPHPYWNKVLVIFCRIGHRRAVFTAGENENVSRELLLKQAHLIPEDVDSSTD